MFYPFKPSRSQRPKDDSMSKLQAKITTIQRDWANRLNARARKLPPQRLKILLGLAGVLACGIAAFLIYQGITPHRKTLHRFDLSLPMLPKSISVPKSPARQQALDQYLDSLENAIISDSIQNAKTRLNHDSSGLH